MMMKKLVSVVAVLSVIGLVSVVPVLASADNTGGYITIAEYKAFTTHVAVVFSNGASHACGGGHPDHYELNHADPGSESMERALHGAFLAGRGVQLRYDCVSGAAIITGVRVR